jgi:maleylacetoacetate isomerase
MSTKLYDYWRSSAAYRVRIALNLKGIAYESVVVDLVAGEHRSPDNLARNPQGLVPTLEIDGQSLTQSLAILEYLDETAPGPRLLPEDPLGRHRVRALAHAVAMEIHPVCNLSVAKHAAALSGAENAMQDWMLHWIGPRLEAFERMLTPGAGRYCHGDAVTMADVVLMPQIYNARRWGVDLAPMPKTMEIVARLEAIPAFAAAHPDKVRPAKDT